MIVVLAMVMSVLVPVVAMPVAVTVRVGRAMRVRMMVVIVAVMMVVTMRVAVRMVLVRADAAHVVVVAGLHGAGLLLVSDDLRAVLAELAVHRRAASLDLRHPVGEGVEH
jgi:hypothetical protein